MAGAPDLDDLDLSRPAAAAEYFRICREVLVHLTVAEAAARFLEEVAQKCEATDAELAAHLREQSRRLAPAEAVRHSVRRGVPPLAQIRDQVAERLRREEDRRRAQAQGPPVLGQARGCLLAIAVCVAVLLGLALWGALWLFGLDNPWGLAIGALVALALFLVTVRAVARLSAPSVSSDW